MYFLKIVFVAKFAMFCVNHVVGAFDFILTYRQRWAHADSGLSVTLQLNLLPSWHWWMTC